MSWAHGSWGIRAATMRDLPVLESILWPPLLAAPRRRWFLRGLAEGEVVVVHSADDTIIYAYAWIYQCFFGHTFVAYLAVQPQYRRNTLAGMLLEAAEGRAITDRVFSSTNASNAPMQRVFERYGWKRCGEIDDLDAGDPEIIYVKHL